MRFCVILSEGTSPRDVPKSKGRRHQLGVTASDGARSA